MPIARIALIGSGDFFRATLYELFKDGNFDVDILDIKFEELIKLDTSIYDLIIVRGDFTTAGGEKAFFDFLLSARGYILVDDGEHLSSEYISQKTSLEEILNKVGNVIFKSPTTTGLPARSSPRIPVNLGVEYIFNGKNYRSTITTLSNNGIFVLTLNPPPKDSHIKLSFAISGEERNIEANGRILYSIGYNLENGIIARPGSADKKIVAYPGMAVYFEEISDSDRDRLISFIQKNA